MQKTVLSFFCLCVLSFLGSVTTSASEQQTAHRCISGVYPHLAYWNKSGECGTGAVVPWADRLWVITYSPHRPQGSGDKLYEITPDLGMTIFPDSVGGTPANRMIHRETNQLVIGPYVIDGDGNVRVIPQSDMYGRLTGNARHLFDPENKIYYATMEEGIYEVDLNTLEVNELYRDNQAQTGWGGIPEGSTSDRPIMDMPGYHGKGLYSGQGRLIYANNGDAAKAAQTRPDVPSGCLAEWDGKSQSWQVVRRNQFTDVRGPGGRYGNENPETDPVWAIGWDHRSLLLMLLDDDKWSAYRLPKAVHTYDGGHGWNTEWPRFNDLGEEDGIVMNMHGMFWHFPRTFRRKNSAGIRPRSTYLKVIGDYCRWEDQLVFGCDDSAVNEFYNKRRAKGGLASPGQSHSNLWFAPPEILDQLGPPLGRGSVWSSEDVVAGQPSDPYLFQGFERRRVYLAHKTDQPVTFTVEVDRLGNDEWTSLTTVEVPADSAVAHDFNSDEAGVWLRVSPNSDCEQATASFHYYNADTRSTNRDPIFAGLAQPTSENLSGGIVRVLGDGRKTLGFGATRVAGDKRMPVKYYELDAELNLKPVEDSGPVKRALQKCAIPSDVLTVDKASAIYVDDDGQRWRLPKGDAAFDHAGLLGAERPDREVVTERDLFNCHGSFYELPARNAGGFAKIRPICTHNLRIKDYCSYLGMLILTGVDSDAAGNNEHIIRSSDGQVALWAGVVDDLWKLGKPVGVGGPWADSEVQAGVASDPYLMTGYDKKSLALNHQGEQTVTVTIQIDMEGTGNWVDYKPVLVPAGETVTEAFSDSFAAYWVRLVSDHSTTATGIFTYE